MEDEYQRRLLMRQKARVERSKKDKGTDDGIEYLAWRYHRQDEKNNGNLPLNLPEIFQ